MRIISTSTLKKYYDVHSDAKDPLLHWVKVVSQAEWRNLADIKTDFPSVDYVGNQHYVFNIKGNTHRLVVVVKFTPRFVFVRFVGTHAEYDKITDCSTL
ncbi:MAG: type II toxin-antitoxin system HigB family toxin [Bacteroides sp.]|nr:type II toxin-antitoxin system HigB family toxin [Bacteroides sp.]MCM1085620.1 type II toxin-antitoxin system HigB family toxin [Bacteroides sp.]MCM1532025.1 type II toxin-antitoxin system HigB family toxin [Ruminococcus flavefaciens]MCM1554040.1 type II toxin-antitoxin system HigB family toxin [Bacteroides sp.]